MIPGTHRSFGTNISNAGGAAQGAPSVDPGFGEPATQAKRSGKPDRISGKTSPKVRVDWDKLPAPLAGDTSYVHKLKLSDPIAVLSGHCSGHGKITSENATRVFYPWAADMMHIKVKLYQEAIASLNGKFPDVGWDDLTAEEKAAGKKAGTTENLAFSWGDVNGISTLAYGMDPCKVAKSTVAVQRFYVFALLLKPLCSAYYRWTFNRGTFKILDTLFSMARQDFETLTDPATFTALVNLRRFFLITKPEDTNMRRWDAIGELHGEGKYSWSNQNFGGPIYGTNATRTETGEVLTDENRAIARAATKAEAAENLSREAAIDINVVHRAQEEDPTELT